MAIKDADIKKTENKIKSWTTASDFSKSQVKMPPRKETTTESDDANDNNDPKTTTASPNTEALFKQAVNAAMPLNAPPLSASANNNNANQSTAPSLFSSEPLSLLPTVPRKSDNTLQPKDPPSLPQTKTTVTTKKIPSKSTKKRLPSKTTVKKPIASKKKRPGPPSNSTSNKEKKSKRSSTTTSKNPPVWEGPPTEAGFDWTGWTKRTFARQGGVTAGHVDRYWYTPVLQKKLRSLTEVKKFNAFLTANHGNEQVAWECLKGKR